MESEASHYSQYRKYFLKLFKKLHPFCECYNIYLSFTLHFGFVNNTIIINPAKPSTRKTYYRHFVPGNNELFGQNGASWEIRAKLTHKVNGEA